MFKSIARKRRGRSNRGQGFTEYASIIAFVAAMIAMVFGMPQSMLANALSSAFGNMTSALNQLVSEVHM
jgi:Flp pilus assembly pilin Flp